VNEQCEAIIAGMSQCRETATGHYRAKAASGQLRDFPLCSRHIIAWQRADQEDKAQRTRKREQAAFVKAWRERNQHRTCLDGWRCPLCNRQVQRGAFRDADFMALTITRHQEMHGQDWRDYLAIGASAPPAETREG